jgi:putative transposase
VTAHQAIHRVATMCRVLGVSPSGYYAWRKRAMAARTRADVELTAYIDEIHRTSRGTYGAPRVHAELGALGIHVGRKRVARLMRALGVCGVSRRKRPRTTVRDHAHRPAPDLVARDFGAPGQIGCGWRTSPTSRPGRGFCTSPSSSTPGAGV